jgi:hypothetical protein
LEVVLNSVSKNAKKEIDNDLKKKLKALDKWVEDKKNKSK